MTANFSVEGENPPSFYERLASDAPEPWLAVMSPGREDYVVGVAGSREGLDLAGLESFWKNWIDDGHQIVSLKDSPALPVRYCAGLFCCGWLNATPAHLAARKNWFLRYRNIVESHLRDPLPAVLYLFDRRPLDDPFCTMRSTKKGPFPFPKDAPWPRCKRCWQRMSFIGSLDCRDYCKLGRTPVPPGSLVLHGCEECTIPCSDEQATSLTWITPDQQVELRGRRRLGMDAIEVGVPWPTIDFPIPAYRPKDFSNDPGFAKEHDIHKQFILPGIKIGGHFDHRSNEEPIPRDRHGNPMQYIGQMIRSRDVRIADCGVVALFYSADTLETKHLLSV